MREELAQRFWADMIVPTQEEDSEVAFANPADVSRSLVKARNWTGTLSQALISVSDRLAIAKVELRRASHTLSAFETVLLAAVSPLPTSAVKNKETQRAFMFNGATPEQRTKLAELEQLVQQAEAAVLLLDTEREQLEIMRRALEKSTDWLVQYINWHKFELRELT